MAEYQAARASAFASMKSGGLQVARTTRAEVAKQEGCQGPLSGTPDSLALLRLNACRYSHSMVAGGLELMSKTTRLMPRTSLMMRFEMRASVS